MHRIHGGQVKKLATVAFGVLLAAVLSGCSTTNKTEVQRPAVPKTFNLRVGVRLSGATNVRGNLETCVGTGQFADVATGAKVVITNQAAKPIAVGTVLSGFGTNYYKDVLDECNFRIGVFGVPRAKGYTIAVGRQHAVPFTRAALIRTNGVFSYDLNPPTVPSPIYTPTTTTKPK